MFLWQWSEKNFPVRFLRVSWVREQVGMTKSGAPDASQIFPPGCGRFWWKQLWTQLQMCVIMKENYIIMWKMREHSYFCQSSVLGSWKNTANIRFAISRSDQVVHSVFCMTSSWHHGDWGTNSTGNSSAQGFSHSLELSHRARYFLRQKHLLSTTVSLMYQGGGAAGRCSTAQGKWSHLKNWNNHCEKVWC